MAKFSAGPWSYGIGNSCHDVYSKDGTKVCEVFENLSDRFLIAAAPEMYELLDRYSHADMSVREWLGLVEKLLKKIDGEDS